MPRSHTRSEAVVETGAGTATGVPPRTVRRRTLRIAAAGLTAVAALGLTACGGQDNPLQTSAAKPFHPVHRDSGAPAARAEGAAPDGARTGGGRTEQVAAGHGGNGTRADAGTRATGAITNGPGKSADAPGVRHRACDAAKIRIVAQPLTRPVNHLLVKATNTSGATCDLYFAPYLRFDAAQSPLPELPDSKPQAVVTLAPGESGYAGVLTSSADGSGRNGRKVTSLSVSLPGRDGKGSIGGSTAVALPLGSVYLDDSAWVTYWQSDAGEAAAW
ncbi:DUF4232 domain-containing protein [Streptomyces hygroscopicus]|uniref:DUF4232 domain-containing protein n=1 Tax=Streptomyces hygroscopicus TaxID=1912 RepID=UPI001FCBA5E4|nr:DUF4232 domain-containing protein [Streptomyces hygroscopicus]BDH08903.1 hypothetical protein HOK021_00820 [Streptomyces hygroscopicus]